MLNTDHPLMSAKEVAEMFGVSQSTVSRWATEGILPTLRLPSGRPRFRREDIEALMQMGEIA